MLNTKLFLFNHIAQHKAATPNKFWFLRFGWKLKPRTELRVSTSARPPPRRRSKQRFNRSSRRFHLIIAWLYPFAKMKRWTTGTFVGPTPRVKGCVSALAISSDTIFSHLFSFIRGVAIESLIGTLKVSLTLKWRIQWEQERASRTIGGTSAQRMSTAWPIASCIRPTRVVSCDGKRSCVSHAMTPLHTTPFPRPFPSSCPSPHHFLS